MDKELIAARELIDVLSDGEDICHTSVCSYGMDEYGDECSCEGPAKYKTYLESKENESGANKVKV